MFFANERTFLAWLHSSVLLAGASIAITNVSKDGLLQLLYGIVLLPVAIAFICYAMHQCKYMLSTSVLVDHSHSYMYIYNSNDILTFTFIIDGKRAQMIRRRSPGPYEDIVGPAVLSVALILSIVTQFSLKLYSILHE